MFFSSHPIRQYCRPMTGVNPWQVGLFCIMVLLLGLSVLTAIRQAGYEEMVVRQEVAGSVMVRKQPENHAVAPQLASPREKLRPEPRLEAALPMVKETPPPTAAEVERSLKSIDYSLEESWAELQNGSTAPLTSEETDRWFEENWTLIRERRRLAVQKHLNENF